MYDKLKQFNFILIISVIPSVSYDFILIYSVHNIILHKSEINNVKLSRT